LQEFDVQFFCANLISRNIRIFWNELKDQEQDEWISALLRRALKTEQIEVFNQLTSAISGCSNQKNSANP
jgi:hypothetical protein